MRESDLDAPLLPNADNGILDLGDIKDDYIQIVISRYAEVNSGDKITIRIEGSNGKDSFLRYGYVSDPGLFSLAGKSIQIRPVSVFSDGQFNITYTVESRSANISISRALSITVINAPSAEADVQYHQATYDGFYLSGVIDSWIVPFDYAISQNDDVLISPLDQVLGAATLSLSRRSQAVGEATVVGTMTYATGQWVFRLSGLGVALKKGDELSLTLASNANLGMTVTV